jgi:hypothetical protein
MKLWLLHTILVTVTIGALGVLMGIILERHGWFDQWWGWPAAIMLGLLLSTLLAELESALVPWSQLSWWRKRS